MIVAGPDTLLSMILQIICMNQVHVEKHPLKLVILGALIIWCIQKDISNVQMTGVLRSCHFKLSPPFWRVSFQCSWKSLPAYCAVKLLPSVFLLAFLSLLCFLMIMSIIVELFLNCTAVCYSDCVRWECCGTC